jgi:hypothetical protein
MIQLLRLSSLSFLLLFSFGLFAQDVPKELENAAENHTTCLKCHGQSFYSFYNDWTETDMRKSMPQEFRIDSVQYYQSSHYSFKCTDCHTPDYETFPHDGELRKEFINTCLDCHGGDETYEHFKFEEIEEAFNSSVHSPDALTNFSCWQCHDPHSYQLDYRNTEDLISTIERNNQACMNCHNSESSMRLFTDEMFKELALSHDFLPNQRAHYEKVRCLECHGEIGEDLMVAHNILPKEESVNNCKECHSKNSILMTSLYRYQSLENKKKFGFYNASLLNESYVIGATRNHWLNVFTIVVFALSILVIITHAIILRISKK